ncbi:hypothetical protein [Glycomyces arizonensis]|uniref:hypothetical protein n=1 Tax=Glycomyces arizonensis TaxID=256035 RepID=UPI000684E729|nr:hypothetical protein [Glycomyces arizonensis]
MSIRPDHATFPEPLPVVLAATNMQALSRLLSDVFPLLEPDPRLGIRFSVIPGSAFERAAHDFLETAGVPVIDWADVRSARPHLIISCSPSRKLFGTRAKFMILPHGAGHNRRRADFDGRIYGLAPQQILLRRRLLPWAKARTPDFLALAGEAGRRLLRRHCPEAERVSKVIGDVCLERMLLSSGPAQRRRYRKALGIEPDQVLVVSSSTWGDLSLVGRGRLDLVPRLLASLPMDRFRVGVIAHPNIEHGRGASLEGVLGPQLANGLIMPTLHDSWRATLIAADVVIGDSGSVTQYAAAIGKPVLLAAFGFDQMTEGTPLHRFGKESAWLDFDKPFAPQLLDAIERGQPFDFGEQLAGHLTPSETLPAKTYELLDTEPPQRTVKPKYLPPPVTVPRCRPTAVWNFRIRFEAGGAHWKRLPVSEPHEASGTVVARTECDDPRLLTKADVVLSHDEALPLDQARDVLDDLRFEWAASSLRSVRIGPDALLLASERLPATGVRCPPAMLDIVPAALHVWLTQHAAEAPGLDAADPLVGFQRRFEPPPTFFPV